jgi:hypothetical protein
VRYEGEPDLPMTYLRPYQGDNDTDLCEVIVEGEWPEGWRRGAGDNDPTARIYACDLTVVEERGPKPVEL